MKKILFLSFLSFFIFSCNQDDDFVVDSDNIATIEAQNEAQNDVFEKDDKVEAIFESEKNFENEENDVDDCLGFVPDNCDSSFSVCVGFDVVKRCRQTKCGTKIVEEKCPDNQGCFAGKCVENRCSDECVLGEEKNGKKCELWDMVSQKWTQTNQKERLFDRFEEYQKWLHLHLLPFGGVSDAEFKTEKLKEVDKYTRTIDSALWTGTYLAAEALRYKVDGSLVAKKNIENLIKTLHLFLNVAGSPGLLSRYAYESSKRDSALGKALKEDMDCNILRVFCDIPYNNKKYDYKGNVSRDQYQGVLLGYSFAYEFLGDEFEDFKKIIRDDVVTFVETIMKKHHFRVKLIYDNIPALTTNGVDARFVVLAPREMKDGAVTINYCSKESDKCKNRIRGFQEFMPDMAKFYNQIKGFPNSPQPIPRASSAIMLSNIFQVAMQVTKNVKGYEAEYNKIKDFYYKNNDKWGNVNDWLKIAKQWKFSGKCGKGYYGINISIEPLYSLLRLEENKEIKAQFLDILKDNIWEKTVKNHKNTFFAYIYTSQTKTEGETLKNATNQFLGFVNAPHVKYGVDLLDDPKYSEKSSSCENQTVDTTAVDVSDRCPADFIWQMPPFNLKCSGDLKKVYPGIDYLIVYWMGRYYKYLKDDSDGKCCRWKE